MASSFRNLFKQKAKGETERLFSDVYVLSNKVLGTGAYAEVRLGTTKAGEKVAIKIIDKTQLKESDLSKLNKEVSILKSLRHPNVVRVYEYFDEPERFLIVMEYVDGGELFEKIISDASFTESESREIIGTLALALKHCKDNGVIHRDVKPENILMTEEGKIKLADFNLSKQLEEGQTDFFVIETMCGTPNYVAPEVISGKPYNYKCDIWSLGVISFLLLSGGYLPFFVTSKADARDDLLRKVKKGKWSFIPSKAWANVSDLGKDFITQVLCKDAERRLSYEELLAHPWFKQGKKLVADVQINVSKIKNMHKLRMMTASKVVDAIEILKDIMEGTEEEVPEETLFAPIGFGEGGVSTSMNFNQSFDM